MVPRYSASKLQIGTPLEYGMTYSAWEWATAAMPETVVKGGRLGSSADANEIRGRDSMEAQKGMG